MKKKVYAYLHTHWDREWYRNKEDFNIRLQNVFDIVLKELNSNRAPYFYFDGQVLALLDYLKYNPQKEDIIKQLIKEKKLSIGPYYVSADTYLISFPCMLKNLEIGMKYSKKFHQKEFIGYMSDVFGISKSAFEALKIMDIDKAVIWRGVNPEDINNNCNFKYDNISTLWLSMGYFNDFTHSGDFINLKKYIDKIFNYSNDSCLLPIGADHLGVLKNASKVIKSMDNEFEIKLTSPFEYFKNNQFKSKPKCTEFLDNSKTYILQGVYSTRINQKIKNVEVENKLAKIVEPLNYYLKEKYDNHIETTYETLLKNHAHDSIYGCSLDSVANAVDNRFDKCNNMLDSILLHITHDFKNKNKINEKSTDKIGLFNLSNTDDIKKVEIKLPYILKNSQILKKEKGFPSKLLADCYKIPVTEDICDIYTQLIEIDTNKKFSFSTVKIKKPEKNHKITDNSIENKNIKLYIKNKSVYIKDKNSEVKLILTDTKDNGDTYNYAPRGKREILPLIKSEILYKGNIQSALRLYYKGLELDIILDNHSKFIRFFANINNTKKNHKLQICIISKNNFEKTIAQDAIGVVERKHDYKYNMQDYMPAKRPVELKTNIYPMQNFVCSNNISVITKGLHEYEIYKNELRICLIRCTGTISNPNNPARAIPAGPDLKTPEAQMQGKLSTEFALLFGNMHDTFNNLDEFMQNYVTIDGEFKKSINFVLDEIPKHSYFYGLSKKRKILYNFKKDSIALI